MKYLYIFGIVLLFINHIYATNEETVKNKEDYYLLFVNNTYGEFKIYSNSKHQKRDKSQLFIDNILIEINNLIADNLDTYQHPEKLEEFEISTNLKKRSNGQSHFSVSNPEYSYVISSIKDTVVVYTYLSKELIPKVKSLDNIEDCIQNEVVFSVDKKYYNEEEILKETYWSGLKVQENADTQLSFLSQDVVNENIINNNKYDNNFYYPTSAGQGINIVILDTSFHFGYSELKSNEERTMKCVTIDDSGNAGMTVIDGACRYHRFNHGEIVSDMAGGLIHGVAKRANIHGVSIPVDNNGGIETKDVIHGLQYIYEKLIIKYKTVVNLSLGGLRSTTDRMYLQYKKYVDGINEKGGIIVASSGNNKRYISKAELQYVPCEFDNVICVGALDSSTKNTMYNIYATSNYGPTVDVYAPGVVKAKIIDNVDIKDVTDHGTSFSTPLVSGMVATIMSEHPNVEYTYKEIREILKKNSTFKPLNSYSGNIFYANNGKHIVYTNDDVDHEKN
ncbi:subtilisin-like protein [Anaeromyces robustus]|uniref:Subtilisin-like protein n=1 Tax=Anaeromyces robustus TaxID=1754192 RepID=A0A1Y1WXY8_9FUNG|nr:subtilisin-like protein [Anaeromyces robustus]|eukprot:ORX78373.1 subtilisin-like protein [Anaeromyces robustus]